MTVTVEAELDAIDFIISVKDSYREDRVWGFLTHSGTCYAVVQNEGGIVAVRSTDKMEVHGKLVSWLHGHHFCKNITLGSICKGDRATIEGFCHTYDEVVRISTSPVVKIFY